MPPRPPRPAALTRSVWLALLLPSATLAAEWFLDPAVSLGYEFHDNIFITTLPHDDVTGQKLASRFDFGVREATWDIRGTAEFRIGRYSKEELDSENGFFKASSRFNTDRDSFRIDLSTTDDSALTGDQVDADTGLVRGQVDRKTEVIAPSWTRSLTERSQLHIGYQLTDVSYEHGQSVRLFDYEQEGLTAQLLYQWSERLQLSLTAGRSEYRVPYTGYNSDSRFYQTGLTHRFSETFDWGVTFGKRETEIDQMGLGCPADTSYYYAGSFFGYLCQLPSGVLEPLRPVTFSSRGSGETYNVNLDKRFELTRVNLNFGRRIDPTGSSTEVETDSVAFRLERPIRSTRLTVSLALEGFKARSIGGYAANTDRDYYRAEPRLQWKMTEHWTLDASYRYTHQKYLTQAEAADANSVYLTVGYRWPRLAVSR